MLRHRRHRDAPPRAVKRPVTSMYLGSMRRIRPFISLFAQSSWKSPWLRELNILYVGVIVKK